MCHWVQMSGLGLFLRLFLLAGLWIRLNTIQCNFHINDTLGPATLSLISTVYIHWDSDPDPDPDWLRLHDRGNSGFKSRFRSPHPCRL